MTGIPDLLVIGGGSAGLVAAKTAAGLGAEVVLVERARFGGDCLWTGCVPSKTLLAAAATVHRMRTADRYGLSPVLPIVDLGKVLAVVRRAITTIEPVDSPDALRAAGVRVLAGDARFTGPSTVSVDGAQLRFRRAVVATGSEPVLPAGVADGLALTSDTVWDLDRLPPSLVVLGAGATGCELAQAFARLGSRVTLLESADRVLPGAEPAASAALRAALTAEGVEVITGARVTGVLPARLGAGGALVERADGPSVRGDRLLVATGRRARVEGLGLDAAGVLLTAAGHVAVDARLRTANPRVLAAGDVTGAMPFTHVAGMAGSVAATNAVLAPLRRAPAAAAIPWTVFTDPEVAQVGLTEAAARVRHRGVVVREVRHADLDRAVTDGATGGLTRAVLDGRGRVLGATVVGPRAGEVIMEFTVLVARRGRLRELAGIAHPYPGWSDSAWKVALADVAARLDTPLPRWAGAALLALRRATTRT